MADAPLSPLHHLDEAHWETGDGAVVLEDRSLAAKFVLHGKPDDPAFQDAVTQTCGLSLPALNKTVEAGDHTLAWLGPREWLLIAPLDEEAELAAAFQSNGIRHVSVGHGRAMIALAGPRALDLLRKGTSLDVHPRRFAPGDCAQTRLARLAVLLVRRAEGIDILCDRGTADYLWRWLKDAGREFGGA